MLETIKNYIENEEQIKLAEELLENFNKVSSKPKEVNLDLQSATLHNFGNQKEINLKFDKSVTFIRGSRGSGKSFILESWLYLLTGSARTTKDIVGEYSKEMTGTLKFNKDMIAKWKRTESKGEVQLLKTDKNGDDLIITDKITEFNKKVEEKIGINPDLLTSTIYFSPRISFQFSRKLPFEIEKLIITIAKLDVWLQLEEFTKKVKKEENDKLQQIIGALGSIDDYEFNEEETKKIVVKLKKEIEDIDSEIAEIKIPDVVKLNKEYNDLLKQQNKINELLDTIDFWESINKKVLELQGDLKTEGEKIEEIGFDEKKLNKLKSELEEARDNLNKIKVEGMAVKSKIDEKKLLTTSSVCPILLRECGDLKGNIVNVEKDINELEHQRKKMADSYELQSALIKNKEKEIEKEAIKEKQVDKIKLIMENMFSLLGENSLKIKKINIEEKKKELKQYSDKKEELKELSLKISSANKDLNKQENQKNELWEHKTELLAQYNNFTQKAEDYKKMKTFLKEKRKLEQRQSDYDVLIQKFGKKEIPKMESMKTLEKINKNLSIVIRELSADGIDLEIDETFSMKAKLKNHDKILSPKVLSDGEVFVTDLAFLISLGLTVFKQKMPILFVDDIFSFQSDKTSLDLLKGLLSLQKKEYIKRLYLASNRFDNLGFDKYSDNIIEVKN